MNNYFTTTLSNLCFSPSPLTGTDENPFISDLFNEEITEVGHIQIIPGTNKLCISAGLKNGEIKLYDIIEPRLEFLRFIFDNTNAKVKKALRFYLQNSRNAQQQVKSARAKKD